MPETPLPKTIGRYEVVRELGRGAMGVVYEAKDLILMRSVALKTLPLETVGEEFRDSFTKRFYQEARAAASLQHSSIVVVYEIGVDEAANALYMSLEFLRGRTLEAVIEAGPMPWKDALRIVGRLADALSLAHENGIVHRDIKPANVMVPKKGEPKIMDFGVAKLDSSKLTTAGDVLGSPAYMAPEQALEARVDARSDLFSLGSVLYEALTGVRAFGSGTFSEILMRLAYEQPKPPSSLVPGIPPEVDEIVAHAMAKAPAERYEKADFMGEDIKDALVGRPLRHTTSREAEHRTSAGSIAAVASTPPKSKGLPRGPLLLPENKRVSLSLLSGPKAGTEHILRHASLLIGREGGNSGAAIELAETQISRMHAMVEARGTRFTVRDLESKNGTFIGEVRVQEHEIEHGSEFQVGTTRFMLLVADL
ncbi:MAG: FHA domain-containing serine/threonine-protein kinase [Vicinamibacteria bacterium]